MVVNLRLLIIINVLQDAEEYFQHVLEVMTRAERAAGARLSSSDATNGASAEPTARAFQWQSEDRIQCSQSGCVSYPTATTSTLSLNIPVESATNKAELSAFKVGCVEILWPCCM